MRIGIPREVKNHEYRVALTPAGVRELTQAGHHVIVEQNCGSAIGFPDQDYLSAGATLVENPEQVFAIAELLVKVKEPQPHECKLLCPYQGLFTYLHLAADPNQARLLQASRATCIAYETVTDVNGGLPLLTPMSEVAGRLSVQAAAHCLEKAQGGRGVLLGGVPGVKPAHICIIGGGVAGLQAARIAMGMSADITVIDRSLPRLKIIDEMFNGRIKTLYSTQQNIEQQLRIADAVIGAVLIPGAKAPKLVSRDMLKHMKKGAVLVDVAIDQGGCFETSRPTTHQVPTYTEEGITHYCVANMPGAVARTSTLALTNATLPFILDLANKGFEAALIENEHLCRGLNIYDGKITHQAVGEAIGEPWCSPMEALKGLSIAS